jgi:hypothetical protein
MTLAELIQALVTPDHLPQGALLQYDVEINTIDGTQQLLSVYYHNNKIVIDIGNE